MVTLFERQTPVQLITLEGEEDGGVKLYLDGYYQFDSETEKCYHGFIASFPLALHGSARRVLIMGGGDALALRDALKFPVEEVMLLELDPGMIEFAAAPPMSALNEGALSDPRARVMVGNALTEIARFPDRYFDVIIADFPAATSAELEELYRPSFYDRILRKLAPGGIFVSQVSENIEFTKELRKFLEVTLGHGMTLIAQPKVTESQPFVYGSTEPFTFRGAIPPESEICGSVAGIARAMADGKKVVVYSPSRKVFRGPRA